MGLSSLHLDAFFSAAQTLNFSQAAKGLHITQSALSQRIKSLEEDLGLTFFVRMPRGVVLTDAGNRLLRYCQARNSMERELLDELTGATEQGLGGQLRIGGYSSVVRSVLIPALTPLLRDNPKVVSHFQNAEMRELPKLLLSGSVDFIVTDSEVHRADLETVKLGEENYVLADSVEFPVTTEIYLDHDPSDPITAQFLAQQSSPPEDWRRSYLDEIYGIIDGVAQGIGKAVVSRHLVANDARLRILESAGSMTVPVLLHHLKQPFYTELQETVIETLTAACPALLHQS